ncbi:MAG TPA: hypothetical protein K8W19_00840 [Victivallis vadensis]|nr:hypothetical protein [Victivallis vadensis]
MQAVFRPDRPEISHHALDDNEIAELSAPNEKVRRYMFFSLRDLQTAENAATLSATQKLNTGTAQL